MVVKVGNLQEFMAEVLPFSDVRLSRHEIVTYSTPLEQMELCLDLMGFNEAEELVWLHHSLRLQLTPGSGEPWTEQGKAVYAAFPALGDLARTYLADHYTVRAGLYGIAQDIAPLNGHLEIARWDRESQTFVLAETEAQG